MVFKGCNYRQRLTAKTSGTYNRELQVVGRIVDTDPSRNRTFLLDPDKGFFLSAGSDPVLSMTINSYQNPIIAYYKIQVYNFFKTVHLLNKICTLRVFECVYIAYGSKSGLVFEVRAGSDPKLAGSATLW